ncbi:BTB/POZ domain-containing protein [Aspergillus clavatus NRRL 1]|uniref:BTB/POZ domain protein n=1 Tax=Aspergillus clavatus (strain ATCC 1007 / CBS 513.65 / DSM 816 / NCTC 3887 / NRRL 1 / QM 1276 / 107) TaxID=344612 RepID=A1CF12_ASPCL|nr:BTB/POZ domain protein [Aspergillus clavatus NRRL 1]EAW11461.1 BTB/POZ domain protein [Aspergillus clavatus NRRL 1]
MGTDMSSLLTALSRKNGSFSDFQVKCGASTFSLHRCIVCPQSRFFDKAMSSQFQETESKEVTIYDDPLIVTKMIDYLYSADYDDSSDKDLPKCQECSDTTESESEEVAIIGSDNEYDVAPAPIWQVKESKAHVNAKVYVIADKYGINELKNLAREKLESNLQHDWKDTEFIPIVEYTYGPECPKQSDLQSIITKYSIQHLSTLKESRRFHEVLKQFPEFGYEFSVLAMEKVAQLEVQLW